MARVTAQRFFSEGHLIQGRLYEPDDTTRGIYGRSGVVLAHGYTGVQTLYFPEIANRLADLGVHVLTFDYKGWGESEGLRTRLAPWSRVADVIAAVTMLKEALNLGLERVGVMGWSFGGSTAVVAGALDERIDFVISVFGVAHGPRWMRVVRGEEEWRELERMSRSDRINRTLYGRSGFVPRSDVLKLDQRSYELAQAVRKVSTGAVNDVPVEFIDDTKLFIPELFVPMLEGRGLQLIACREDHVVPFSEAEAMYQAARDPKQLVELKGYGHYELYTGPGLNDVMGSVRPFLERMAAKEG